MIEYSKISSNIDEIADKLQEMGHKEAAEHLDMVANTIDAMEAEAGALSKFLGSLLLLGAGFLSPGQAQEAKQGKIPMLNEQQISVLERTDPQQADDYKNYLAIQNTRAQQRTFERGGLPSYSPEQLKRMKKTDPKTYKAYMERQKKEQAARETRMRQRQRNLPGGPSMTGEEREVAEVSEYSNPSRGPGSMQMVKYKEGPGESRGEAPSPGGGYGGSAKKFFQQTGDYIPKSM